MTVDQEGDGSHSNLLEESGSQDDDDVLLEVNSTTPTWRHCADMVAGRAAAE